MNKEDIIKDVRRVFSTLSVVAPFSYPLLMMPIHIREDIPSWAGTNGVSFFVNPKEWNKLDFREKLFVGMHEWIHVVMQHAKRMQGRRRRIWNYACFPEGIVSGSNKDISEIKEGDSVFQKGGEGLSVTPLNKEYNDELVVIRPFGSIELRATKEHPFLVAERKGKYTPVSFKPGLHWVKAEDLIEGKHYLVLPNVVSKEYDSAYDLTRYSKVYTDSLGRTYSGKYGNVRLDKLELNQDIAWLMGLYLADGSHDKASVRFHLAGHEKEYINAIQKIASDLNHSSSTSLHHEDNMCNVYIGSSILARFFKDKIGKSFDTKLVPDEIFYNKDLDIVKSFIDGVFAGDGSYEHNGKSKVITISNKPAILQLQMMLMRCGIYGCVSEVVQRDRVINETFVKGGAKIWYLRWTENKAESYRNLNSKKIRTSNSRCKKHEGYNVVPIRSIKCEHYSGSVYNLECNGDHTYSINNFIVHNCDYAVNDLIMNEMQDQFTPPPGVLLDQDFFYDKSAEEIYNMLLEMMDDKKENNEDPSCNHCGQSFQKGDRMAKDGETSCGGCGRPSNFNMPTPEFLDAEDGVNQLMADDYGAPWGNDLSQMPSDVDDQEMIDAIIKAAARARGMKRGFVPGKYEDYVNQLKKSHVPWERLLFRYAKESLRGSTDRNPFRPDPKYLPFDVFIPREQGRRVGKLVFIVDTSASMETKEFEYVCGHLEKLGSLVDKCTVITADTKVQDVFRVKRIKRELAKGKIKFKGRGGTDMTEAFKLAEKLDPQLIVLYSDMHIGDWPTKPKKANCIFLATKKSELEESPYGVFIKMDNAR